MSYDNRINRPGPSVFFTLCLERTGATLLTDHIDSLRFAFRQTMRERPFYIDAIVVLPDHLHTVMTFPPDDPDFASRLTLIKSRFAKRVPNSSASARNIWERRNWEHRIKDRKDHKEHIGFCITDPVRHGYVSEPTEWQFSSIHRDLDTGIKAARFAV